MERKLLVASTNVKKTGEMLAILRAAELELELVTLTTFPLAPVVEETGSTFLENARLKALAGLAHTGMVTIADDGGLCIDALDGSPGVRSHRFLGESSSFPEKMSHILELMRHVPNEKRTCRFQCSVVIAVPDGSTYECAGVCEGRIGDSMHGDNGFGYDPIFYIPELGRYMAELMPGEKQLISHRGKALECAANVLRGVFE